MRRRRALATTRRWEPDDLTSRESVTAFGRSDASAICWFIRIRQTLRGLFDSSIWPAIYLGSWAAYATESVWVRQHTAGGQPGPPVPTGSAFNWPDIGTRRRAQPTTCQ